MSAQPAVRLPVESTSRPPVLESVVAPRGPAVSVVVPCYNEAEGLPSLLARLERMESLGWEFIFIDDGSRDGTFTALLAAARCQCATCSGSTAAPTSAASA